MTNNRNLTHYHPHDADYMESWFIPAIRDGLSAFMQIVCFCKLSVAHFNSAVTVGFFVAGQISFVMSVVYIIVQCFASVLAASVAKLILGETPSAILVGDDLNGASVFLHEAFITGILMFYAAATAIDPSFDQPLGALAVGLTVFQGIIAG